MNLLDENIPENQRQLLRSWKIRISQIGCEVGEKGVKDENIIPPSHKLPKVTFFTRDFGFSNHQLCHPNCCIVAMAVGQYEVSSFVRRLLRHSLFNTKTKRMGKVILISHSGIHYWRRHSAREEHANWTF